MIEESGRVASPNRLSSQAIEPPSSGSLDPAGFDPAREHYRFENEWTMKREGGHNWHLRNSRGDLVDSDQYRHDLIERYRLTIAVHHDPFAIAMEARQGGDAEGGSVACDDSAGPKDIAQ